MKPLFPVAILLIALVAPAAMLTAQESEPTVAAARDALKGQRRAAILKHLPMTLEEAEGFWLVYEDYREDMDKVTDATLTVIEKYAAEYRNRSLTDERATVLLKDWFAVEKQRIKTKEKYLHRFDDVLPGTKVLRFYQIENKLDTAVNVEFSREVPLAE